MLGSASFQALSCSCTRRIEMREQPLFARRSLDQHIADSPNFGSTRSRHETSAPLASKSLNLLRGESQCRRLRSVYIFLWFFTRRHLRYIAYEFLFLWRKISVSARFDLPPPSFGRHGKQSLNHVSHFLPRNRVLLVVRQPVFRRVSVSGRFAADELHRRNVVYAGRSRPRIARILPLRVITPVSVATVVWIRVRWRICARPIVW